MRVRHVFAALLLNVHSAMAADALTPAKQADIRKLMEITGSAGIAQQFATAIGQAMFRQLKTQRPDIPDRAITVMERELLSLFSERMTAPGGLMEQIIPVYDRHFTHAEIQEVLAFYATPTGRKAIGVLPRIMSESMAIGQRWGQSLGPEIERRIGATLKREGLVK